MEFLVGLFVFSVAVGVLAAIRGRHGFGWFLLAIIISPLIAGIFCLAANNLSNVDAEKPTPETHVKCPDCREFVLKDARKCKHCGTALIPQ